MENRLLSKFRELRDELREHFNSSPDKVTYDKAFKFSAVYSAIKVIAETIGQMSVSVYTINNNGDKIDDNGNILFTLLHNSPNKYQNSSDFHNTVIARALIFGNCYIEVARDRSMNVTGLHIITKSVEVKFNDKSKEIFYQIEGESKPRLSSDIIHIKNISLDGLKGASPIDELNETIGLGISQQDFANSFFKNGATVNGILTKDGTLTPEQATSMLDRWKKAFGNKNKKGNGTAVLDGSWKYQVIGTSPEQSQLLESRKFAILEIARIFRVPPHLIMEMSNATFSNIEHQSTEFVKYTLNPWIKKLEQEYKNKLFKEAEKNTKGVRFNVESLMRGDTQARSEYFVKAIQNGWMSPNEVRQLEGWNKREDGDIYLTPMNLTTNPNNQNNGKGN